MSGRCPKCGWPDVRTVAKMVVSFKGIYTPGKECPHCHETEKDPPPCCALMRDQLNAKEPCRHHTTFQCPDVLIVRIPARWDPNKGDTIPARYVLPIKDGTDSFIEIHYCPFCGKKLGA